jgi:hypothetical protein
LRTSKHITSEARQTETVSYKWIRHRRDGTQGWKRFVAGRQPGNGTPVVQVQTALPSGMETSDDDPSFAELVEYVESWVNNKANLLKKKVWVEEAEKLVRNEHGADPEMLAKVKMMEAEWEMPDS